MVKLKQLEIGRIFMIDFARSKEIFLRIYDSEELANRVECYINKHKTTVKLYLVLCNQNRCQLNVCQENGTEGLCDCLSTSLTLFTQTGNPRGGFLKGTVKMDGTLDLICRNFMCTEFRSLAHCRPAESRQYH